MSVKQSLKRKFVQQGLQYAEIDQFLQREIAKYGYIGMTLTRNSESSLNIVLYVSSAKTQFGEDKTINELAHLISDRFGIPEGGLKIFVSKVPGRGMNASSQCETLKNKLAMGVPVRRAAYSALKFVMENGARGCEVVISGKIRGQRAKAMKFVDGIMIHAGHPASHLVDEAVRHVYMRQGMLGVRVKINKSHDAASFMNNTGRRDYTKSLKDLLPDQVIIYDQKDENNDFGDVRTVVHPSPSEEKEGNVAGHDAGGHQQQQFRYNTNI